MRSFKSVVRLLASIESTSDESETIRDAFKMLAVLGGLSSEDRSKMVDDEAGDLALALLERAMVDLHRAAHAARESAFLQSEILTELRRANGML